jgi:hypothetical protein
MSSALYVNQLKPRASASAQKPRERLAAMPANPPELKNAARVPVTVGQYTGVSVSVNDQYVFGIVNRGSRRRTQKRNDASGVGPRHGATIASALDGASTNSENVRAVASRLLALSIAATLVHAVCALLVPRTCNANV